MSRCGNDHAAPLLLALMVCVPSCAAAARAQVVRRPSGPDAAVVIDERLSALRSEPRLTAPLLRRLGRGRTVAIVGARRSPDGVSFYRVAVTRRTRGWLQAESVVWPGRAGEDERLRQLILASAEFDRIARARIFLDSFPRAPARPEVLLLYGDAAEGAAGALTRQAARRLGERPGVAPLHSYYLNFSGLDRLNRVGARYVFDGAARRLRYEGAAWREILRRYPRSPQAVEARQRLASLPLPSEDQRGFQLPVRK